MNWLTLSLYVFLLLKSVEPFFVTLRTGNGEKLLGLKAKESSVSESVTSVLDDKRREFLRVSPFLAGILSASWTSNVAQAAVGTLPEFSETNAVLQGITVSVADKSQQDAMIAFLVEGFDCEVLRKRIRGPVEETWLGFGPEQLSIPKDFVLPVSSFSQYGGHTSIHIFYDSRTTTVPYRIGNPAPGDNVAYLQIAVPGYRISRMVANGGNVLDAYGTVNVVSPSGLPIRGIVGFVPDPIMFVAINCADVKASKGFYEKLGFVELEVPYARPSRGTTILEPAPPPKSVYMATSPNSMGVLLLPMDKKKRITPNPAVQSLDIVYTPAQTVDADIAAIVDPSGISISFQSVSKFEKDEKETR